MRGEWRLNPPPNWPVATDARIDLDWRPDPAWGPPPTGWQLWQRSPRRPPLAGPALAVLIMGMLLGATVVAPDPGTSAPADTPGASGSALPAVWVAPACPQPARSRSSCR